MSFYIYQALKGLGLSDGRLIRLIPEVSSWDHQNGDFLDGDSASSKDWLHVVSGIVCSSLGSSETSIPLEIYGPGSWICNSAASFSSPSVLQSLTTSRVLRIPALLAEEAFNYELPVCNFVAKVAEWRGHLRAERLILSKVGDPWGSVLLELALLGRSLACSSSHLPGVMLDGALRVPLKQLPLSGYLGVSRSLLSGCFRALRAEGWLEVGYGSFDLLKPKVWDALYSSHVQDRSGFYKMTMPELLQTMQQLEGEIYA